MWVGGDLFQCFIISPQVGGGMDSWVQGKNYRGTSKVERASPYILANYPILGA